MTPARREGNLNFSDHPGKNMDARPLKEYVEVIEEKGKKYHIPVLNLYENLGINPNLEEDRIRFTMDGLHLNDEGHKVLAECLIRFLKNL